MWEGSEGGVVVKRRTVLGAVSEGKERQKTGRGKASYEPAAVRDAKGPMFASRFPPGSRRLDGYGTNICKQRRTPSARRFLLCTCTLPYSNVMQVLQRGAARGVITAHQRDILIKDLAEEVGGLIRM